MVIAQAYRRNLVFAVATFAILVLLLSYPTSHSGPSARIAGPSVRAHVVVPSSDGRSLEPPAGEGTPPAGVTTIDGTAVDTEYGRMQVEITVSGGRLTDVVVLRQTCCQSHDEEINAYALPVLRREAVQAQSAHVDVVTGATSTSQGYLESLQSALDLAHLR